MATVSKRSLSGLLRGFSRLPAEDRYAAPKVISGDVVVSEKADVYDFGMVVYEFTTGTHSFGRHTLEELKVIAPQGLRAPD